MTAPFTFGSDVWPGLAKLVEEAGEVGQVAGKVVMTGGAERHWDGSDLRQRLEDEIADVLAAAEFVMRRNHLDRDAMRARATRKLALFEAWRDEQMKGSR